MMSTPVQRKIQIRTKFTAASWPLPVPISAITPRRKHSILAFIFFLYNTFYVFQIFRRPQHTNLGYNLQARKMWVENLMANAAGSILGIQALRNSILSATFYATACATIAFFAAGEAMNACGLRRTQGFVLTLVLLWCFIHWTIAIKGQTHMSFLISGEDFTHPLSEEEKFYREQRVRFAQALISNITIHYALGMRGFFLALCVAGWALGPFACFCITLACIVYMFFSDHSFRKFCF